VEHELGIDTKIVRQSKAGRVLLSVIRKLLTQTDKHAIKPAQHVRRVVNLSLKHCYSGHQDGRCLLIEGCGDGGRTCLGEITRNGRHTKSLLARRVLIVGNELDESSRAWLQGLSGGSNDFEINGG